MREVKSAQTSCVGKNDKRLRSVWQNDVKECYRIIGKGLWEVDANEDAPT